MPDGSSSAAPVTSPGPSSRRTMFLGFLVSARLVPAMKFFDDRDQLNRQPPAWDIRGFLSAIKIIHGLRSADRQTRAELCVAPCHADKHPKNSSRPSMRYFAVSSRLISST